jgi:hypothetical protein
MSPQIEKQQFRNTTDGWIGAVQISVKGEELGVAVEPGGTVWLSEAEQILTANAPRDPADNPFIPQKMQRRNPETDALEDVDVTPLVAVSENRYVPANERPIPADLAETDTSAEAAAAATAEEPTTPVPAEGSEEAPAQVHEQAVVESGAETAPGAVPPPARAAAAAAAAQQAESAPEAPSEPQAPAGPPAPTAPLPPGADPSVSVPEDEGRAPQSVEEETAAVSPGPAHEETGAALPPSAAAPVGEYLAGEEVGTPEAPTTGTAASDISAPAPAPLTED